MDIQVIFQKRPIAIICAFLVIAISYAIIKDSWDVALGFLLGVFTTIVYFAILVRRVSKSSELPVKTAVTYMKVGWILRLIMVVSTVTIAAQIPVFNLFAVILGLILSQLVIMGTVAGTNLK
ncbi:ATP synthase subunit I [Bacillota bacterium LX-D]|nr:ATP synthase subunit I [Bacillota bacterium LX-D]